MYMAYIIQADIKYRHIRKMDGNRYWWKLCLFIDMVCLVMVDWLLLHMLKIYIILSTILMCLSTGDWIYLHVLQRCKFFCILLQNCYFLINSMKKVGNLLYYEYVTMMSPTTGDNRNCWWCWTVLSPIVDLQYVRLWIILMIFDGFELHFIQLLRLL